MELFLVLLLSVLTFYGGISGVLSCEEGKLWKEDCNTCTCHMGMPFCSDMECNPPVVARPKLSAFDVQSCEEGTLWKEDCNTCSCYMGVPSCSEIECNPPVEKLPKMDTFDVRRCEKEKEWLDDCNTCSCINGMVLCTAMDCKPSEVDIPKESTTYMPGCETGAEWEEDCNMCACFGGKAYCTDLECKHVEEFFPKQSTSVKKGCEEGILWKEDCNTCSCYMGTTYCTEIVCKPPEVNLLRTSAWRKKREINLVVKPNFYSDSCKNGEVWRDQDCNRCSCDDEKAVCTKRLCPDGKKLSPTPGWEDIVVLELEEGGLGHKQDERRKRDASVVKPNSYKYDCQPGDHWTDQDCNNCSCDDDKKAVCTKRKCSSGQKLTPTQGWEGMFNTNF